MGHVMTVKGQVTVPKSVRDHLGLTPGCRVEFEVGRDGSVRLHKAPSTAAARHEQLRKAAGTMALPDGLTPENFLDVMRGERDDL